MLFMYLWRRLLESRRLTWRIFSNYREQNLQFAEWEAIFQITNLIFPGSGVAEIETFKLQWNRGNNMASINSCTLLVVNNDALKWENDLIGAKISQHDLKWHKLKLYLKWPKIISNGKFCNNFAFKAILGCWILVVMTFKFLIFSNRAIVPGETDKGNCSFVSAHN